MRQTVTIGKAARETGVKIATIRFYETEGIIPPPSRTPAGYRLYTQTDIRRLRLVTRGRLLGLSLPELKTLVDRAFSSTCAEYAAELYTLIASRRSDITRQMAGLEALSSQLDDLERHVREAHCADEGQDGATGDSRSSVKRVEQCDFCPLIDEEGT